MPKVINAILALCLALSVNAQDAVAVGGTSPSAADDAINAKRFETARIRAGRFFKYQEWQSALDIYEEMMDIRPDDVATYYHAIMACGMTGNENRQMDIFERTQKQGIALDSIFSGVKKVSFEIGEGDEYEKLLLLVRSRQPWLTRGINVYLLEYYDFRHDARGVIRIAESMLSDTPESLQLTRILARAYMLDNRSGDAVRCYRHIVEQVPDDYDALLNLGIFYYTSLPAASEAQRADFAALAQAYLTDAWRVNPTPHVAQILRNLGEK